MNKPMYFILSSKIIPISLFENVIFSVERYRRQTSIYFVELPLYPQNVRLSGFLRYEYSGGGLPTCLHIPRKSP